MKSTSILRLFFFLSIAFLFASCDEYEEWEPDVIWARLDVYYYAYDNEYRGEGYFLHLTFMDDETRDLIGGATVTVGDVHVTEDTVKIGSTVEYYKYELDLDSLLALDDEYEISMSFDTGAHVAATIRKFELPVIDQFVDADTVRHDGEYELFVSDLGDFTEMNIRASDDGLIDEIDLSQPGTYTLDLEWMGNYGDISVKQELELVGESYRKTGEPILQVIRTDLYREYVTLLRQGYP